MAVVRAHWLCVPFFVMSALAAAPVAAQSSDSLARKSAPAYRFRMLAIYDADSGEPITGVRVTDILSGTFTETGATGTISLFFLPDNGSLVRLQKVGYEMQAFPVGISPKDTVGLTVLMRRVTQLPTVVTKDSAPTHVSPALRGFDDRRKSESGYFITEAQLRKEDSRQLANVLQAHGAGVIISRLRGNRSLLMASPQCMDGRHSGPPEVYLDGLPVPGVGGATSAIDLTQFDVSDLAGVEWYPSSDMVPVQFNHTSGRCGALLLWTREK